MEGPKKRKHSKDGLWLRGRVWWTTVAGERVSTGCKDREAARIIRARFEREAADPANTAARRTTVGDMIADVLEDRRRAKGVGGRLMSKETIDMWETKLGHVARVLGVDTPLAEVDYDAVGKYISAREKEPGAAADSLLSQHTISKEVGMLRFGLRLEKAKGRYPHDVDHVTRKGRLAVGYVPRKRHLTWDEIPKLLAALFWSPGLAETAQSPVRAQQAAWIIATAARRKESYSAELADHDLESWTVLIRGTKTSGSMAPITIAPGFRRILEFSLWERPSKGPLFPVWLNMNRALAKACVRAGIPRVSANDLRRTHASLLRQAKVSNDDIRTVTRHMSTRMLDLVYSRTTIESSAKALEHVVWPALPAKEEA